MQPDKSKPATDSDRELAVFNMIKESGKIQHNKLVESIIAKGLMAKTTAEKIIKRLIIMNLVDVEQEKNRKFYSLRSDTAGKGTKHDKETDLERFMKLAFLPCISPRFVISKEGKPILFLENVGNGSAVDIQFKIKKVDDNKLLSIVNRFAFTPRDVPHNTGIDFSKNPVVKIEGSYKDIAGKEYQVKKMITFPPKIESL